LAAEDNILVLEVSKYYRRL